MPPLLVGNEEDRLLVDELDIAYAPITLNASLRNTAPGLALTTWGSLQVKVYDPHLAVMPVDQISQKTAAFQGAVPIVAPLAHQGIELVTVGIRPTATSTGYGDHKLGGRNCLVIPPPSAEDIYVRVGKV